MDAEQTAPGVLLVAPGPYEVALTRLPPGVIARLVREGCEPFDLWPVNYLRYASAPGSAVPWGATWSTWMDSAGIRRYRHARDRAVWEKAARMAAPRSKDETPGPVYVAHVRRTENGKQVWVAVSVRQEGSR